MTLISIIGEFDTTLLNLVKEFAQELKKIVLVFDDTVASPKNLERHAKSLEQFRAKYDLSYTVETAPIIDEDSSQKIEKVCEIVQSYNDVYLDISNALGSTAAFIGAKAGSNVTMVAFNPIENEYNLIRNATLTNHKIKNPLGVVDYIESLGYTTCLKRNEPPRSKEEVFYLFDHFFDFQSVRKDLMKSNRLTIGTSEKMRKALRELGIIDSDGTLIERNYLQGGTYEDYVYWVAMELGFDDLISSLEIRFDGDQRTGTLVNNEFDLLGFKNNRLYLFECKFTKSFELNQLIYKYMALKEHIKNDSKGLIVTLNPKLTPHQEKNHPDHVTPKLKKQADLFDIHVVADVLNRSDLQARLESIIHPMGRTLADSAKPSEKPKKLLYFLGGNDLEMSEIRSLLRRHNADYRDNHLSWGAKLSDYADDLHSLPPDTIPVFVELELDIPFEGEFQIIDHHGDYAHLPSSLEQIAKRFGVKLDRFQTLVSINDRSHIRGLKQYGATAKEIDTIRSMDRRTQGVNEHDETLSLEALKHVKVINALPVIKTASNHFSPITDRVSYSTYLIYNDNKLCLYTERIKKAHTLFKTLIENREAYYGGEKQLYFCVKDGVMNRSELENFIQKISRKI
ncbi:MAG: hypothetical protein AB7S65_11370 [Sulfuricurvum sp.]